MTQTSPMNREAWLTAFMNEALPIVQSRTGLSVGNKKIQISCGFPASGGRRRKNGGMTLGQCFHTHTADGTKHREVFQIFIHPTNTTPEEIGGVVFHEILHALLPAGVSHKKPFSQACKALGLEGKPTATTPSVELVERSKEIAAKLGDYPHEKLEASSKAQATRLLKVMCPVCGYVARVTAKWLDEAGAPICPQCDASFEEAGVGEQASSPLVSVNQTIEYKVKGEYDPKTKKTIFDPRFSVQMNRQGRDIQWFVIDYGTHVLGAELPRLTPAESREDATDLIEALRVGTVTYADLEPDTDDIDVDFEDDFESDPEEDQADLHYLDDDEDEHPDFEDGHVADEESYEAEKANRENISVGIQNKPGPRIEREIGSMQYHFVN